MTNEIDFDRLAEIIRNGIDRGLAAGQSKETVRRWATNFITTDEINSAGTLAGDSEVIDDAIINHVELAKCFGEW